MSLNGMRFSGGCNPVVQLLNKQVRNFVAQGVSQHREAPSHSKVMDQFRGPSNHYRSLKIGAHVLVRRCRHELSRSWRTG